MSIGHLSKDEGMFILQQGILSAFMSRKNAGIRVYKVKSIKLEYVRLGGTAVF